MTGKRDRLTVRLSGGGPWGFRLQGGYGTGLPLTVYKVRRKSKSYRNLREGDTIVSVNGHPCECLTYEQVMEIANKSGTELCLEVLREVSNKENVDPGIKTTSKQILTEKFSGTNAATSAGEGGIQMENAVLKKEEITLTESTTKVTEQTDGLRIKSFSVQPELSLTMRSEVRSPVYEIKPHKELHESSTLSSNVTSSSTPEPSPFDTSTKSVSEEVSSDDRKFEKTTTETVHEKRGNTETTFTKKEHESITKDGSVKFNDLETLCPNGHVNFGSSVLSTAFDTKGASTMGETRTFTSFESSSVKETSSTYHGDSQKSVSDIFSSITAPFSEEPKDSVFSTLMANTATTSESLEEIKKHPGSLLPLPLHPHPSSSSSSPKPKLRPFSDPCVEGLLERQDDCLWDLPRSSMDTDSLDQKSADLFGYSGPILVTKKKKMFSSSSFYEEPQSIYPTVEEQVEMAKKIADSLADDTNRKSKGANMFFKRVKRSTKWVHEGPEPSDESEPTTPEVQGAEPPTPDPSQVPWKSKQGVTKLKLVLDPRHPEDAVTLKSSGHNISEHNVVSPDICHDLVRDLQSPVGKGAALFAKRQKKSSEWVVDEEKVKNLLKAQEPPPPSPVMSASNKIVVNPRVKLLKSPWEAALESPIGSCDAAFYEVQRGVLADSVIRAAENKLQDLAPERSSTPQQMETCRTPPIPLTPAAAYYEIYKPKAPKGWDGGPSTPAADSGSSYSLPTASAYMTTDSVVDRPVYQTSSLPRKMVFHNFNATPRLWKSPAK